MLALVLTLPCFGLIRELTWQERDLCFGLGWFSSRISGCICLSRETHDGSHAGEVAGGHGCPCEGTPLWTAACWFDDLI